MICQHEYRHAKELRLKHPLPHGEYKLLEFRDRRERSLTEVYRIGAYRRGECPGYDLQLCTTEDAATWLKSVPKRTAHLIGYELIPSIAALTGNGVDPSRLERLLPHFQAQAEALVDECEKVHQRLKRNIKVEYDLMLSGNSLVAPLLERAISIADEALGLVDAHPPRDRPSAPTFPEVNEH
jgi:hypothetical protein